MLNVINSILNKQDEIIEMTMWYQNENETEHVEKYNILYNYFYIFSNDEIMLLQSIMYFGRERFTNDDYFISDTKVGAMSKWFQYRCFSLGKKINKDVEICGIVNKGLKVGTYFNVGFQELNKLK